MHSAFISVVPSGHVFGDTSFAIAAAAMRELRALRRTDSVETITYVCHKRSLTALETHLDAGVFVAVGYVTLRRRS